MVFHIFGYKKITIKSDYALITSIVSRFPIYFLGNATIFYIYSLCLDVNNFEIFQLCGLITSEPFGGKNLKFHQKIRNLSEIRLSK